MSIISPKSLNKTATHPLQTSYWADFRREWGNKVVVSKYGNIMVHPIPFSKFAVGTFIRGPEPTTKMLTELKEIAKDHNLIFIKLEPNVITQTRNTNFETLNKSKINNPKSIIKILKDSGCVKGKTLFTPTSFQIDITKSEKELLQNFHQKTRYNIRYSQKQGVTATEDNSSKAFDHYIRLTRETVQRQGFYAHTEKYHRLMWKYLHTDMVKKRAKPIARLMTAKYNDEILTTWVVFVWKDFLYYPYGASTDTHKNVQANSLMMWKSILYGKKNKLAVFDLWGREEGKGFTKFKEGFSPNIVHFIGTWDLVTSPLYYPYLFVDRMRWKLLKLRSKFNTSASTF